MLKEGAFPKITPKSIFALSAGYAHPSDELKFVNAMVALLSDGNYDMIISAPNREVEARSLRQLGTELRAVWSDISIAMRRFKGQSLYMLVLDEVLGLKLSNLSRLLILKPGIYDDHQVIVGMSIDLWFKGMEIKEEGEKGKSPKKRKLTGKLKL